MSINTVTKGRDLLKELKLKNCVWSHIIAERYRKIILPLHDARHRQNLNSLGIDPQRVERSRFNVGEINNVLRSLKTEYDRIFEEFKDQSKI